MRGNYPLGRAQWKILEILLWDGGELYTHEIMEGVGGARVRVLRKLRTLEERGLVTSRKIGRSNLWSLRVRSG